MPRPKRSGPKRRVGASALDLPLLYALVNGRDWFNELTRDDLLRAWGEHGEWILETWIGHFPGSRPLAWWLVEGREPRVLPGQEGRVGERDRIFGVLWTRYHPPLQESQSDYLRRENLLTPDEAGALARMGGWEADPIDVLTGAARDEGVWSDG